jgi:hypothetical protein
MYAEVADNTAPLAAWFHALLDVVFGRSLLARHILAFLLIFFQSAYLGIIFITKKVFNENTFIPSMIFSVLFFFSFDTIALTDELLGSGFLLLALNNLFKEIEFRMPRDETTFNLGIYISLASLFYFPYVTFLFAVLISLFLFARASGRKYLLLIFGFLLPHLFILSFTYLRDSSSRILEYYYGSSLSIGTVFMMPLKGLLLLGAVGIFYLLISIVMLNRLARFSKYQAQTLQSIFLWMGFCFIYFIFCPELRPQTLVVLIPPLTFLLTHFLLLIRRRKFAEMNTLILLIGTITISYLARYDKLASADYSKLYVNPVPDNPIKDKRILVLNGTKAYYLNNTPATRFINWDIAKSVFENPDYYESQTDVYDAFKLDAPDVIIDKQDLMKPFLDRMPEFKKQYERRGGNYVKTKISN